MTNGKNYDKVQIEKRTKSPERKYMMTVQFAYYLNRRSFDEALLSDKEQSLDFMRSYKVRKRRKDCVI